MTGIHDHSFGARLGTPAVIVHRNGFGTTTHEVSDGTRYTIRPNGSVERVSSKKCERYGGPCFRGFAPMGLPLNKSKIRRLNKAADNK